MTTRRHFLQQSGMLAAAAVVSPGSLFERRKAPIGLQLYTLREALKQDVTTTISSVARIGYREVETFGYDPGGGGFWGLSPEVFRKLLSDNGLRSPSHHFSFEGDVKQGRSDDIAVMIDVARRMGQQYLVYAYLPASMRTSANDYRRLAAQLNIWGEACRKAGLQLAYHNHDFELLPFPDGAVGYDILLKETSTDLVKMELDLFWATKAGRNPIDLFRQAPGRFAMWHVKDMNPATHTFTEVGTGSIDFHAIFKKAKEAGMQHFFVEQDAIQGDLLESVSKSYAYVRRKLA